MDARSKGGQFAYVNFQSTLGITLELNRGGGPREPSPSPPASDGLPPLATLNVSHVGFAVTDAAAVANGFAKVLGITPPKVMDYKDAQYPPGAKWNKGRTCAWRPGIRPALASSLSSLSVDRPRGPNLSRGSREPQRSTSPSMPAIGWTR